MEFAFGVFGKNHPQLQRFRGCSDAVRVIESYLFGVYNESVRRKYSFDRSKIARIEPRVARLRVTSGQIDFERGHLLMRRSVEQRDKNKFAVLKKTIKMRLHPLFSYAENSKLLSL
jgi:hypothetical protein